MRMAEFLDTRQAAAFLGTDAKGRSLIAPATLERWRQEGRGPAFRKFGRRCLYAREDLLSWAGSRKRQSTRGHAAA